MGHPGANKPGGQREIVKAIPCALENGIQWRAMPHDLPHGSAVYPYFRKGQKQGVRERPAATEREKGVRP